jgi:hypothetical protein
MTKQFPRLSLHPAEIWSRAWCAYIRSDMAKKSDRAATTATIFADACTEDYVKRFNRPGMPPEEVALEKPAKAQKPAS